MKKFMVIAAALIIMVSSGCNSNSLQQVGNIQSDGSMRVTGEITSSYENYGGKVEIEFKVDGRKWQAEFYPDDSNNTTAAANWFKDAVGENAVFYGEVDDNNKLKVTKVFVRSKKITTDTKFAQPKKSKSVEVPTESPTEVITEASTETPTQITTESVINPNSQNKIYENDKFVFYFKGTKVSGNNLDVYFTIENKTTNTYLIQCDYLTLNKNTYNSVIMSHYVQGGTKSLVKTTIMDDFVDTEMKITSAGGQFRIYDESGEKIETIKINDNKF